MIFLKEMANGLRFTNVLPIGLIWVFLKKIFEKLSVDSDLEELSIDSSYVKAHKAATGAKKKGFDFNGSKSGR